MLRELFVHCLVGRGTGDDRHRESWGNQWGFLKALSLGLRGPWSYILALWKWKSRQSERSLNPLGLTQDHSTGCFAVAGVDGAGWCLLIFFLKKARNRVWGNYSLSCHTSVSGIQVQAVPERKEQPAEIWNELCGEFHWHW